MSTTLIAKQFFLRVFFVALIVLPFFLAVPQFALGQNHSLGNGSPIAVTIPITGSELSYGDLIDYDSSTNQFVLSQKSDDGNVFGVAAENPPLVLVSPPGKVPVMRAGIVLVNVTLEGGPIKIGDSIIASSVPGKGTKAATSSAHVIGYAQESFNGTGASAKLIRTSAGKNVYAGTIGVLLSDTLQSGTGAGATAPIDTLCNPTIKCVPFGLFVRYGLAALIAFGSVYLAFRSFMSDAVNGVISVGRNPRARGEIQGMVAFNAVLASALALAGLIAGVVILFIQI